jgi:serine/threonine protein kinase
MNLSFGRYETLDTGMGGGMGDIAVCRDKHLDRKVIVKTLKDGQDDRRLIDERKALLKLRSKHVVQLYDVIRSTDENDKPAIVLEFIEGNDLQIGQFQDPYHHLQAIWQIACGLAAIHEQNIIHRDIKPNNIRMDWTGVIKILDFGLARTVGLDAKTLSPIGTPGFMAPELWKTNNISFDRSIDVYAYAITCLALRTDQLPQELFQWPPAELSPGALIPLLPGFPADVVALLEASLSANPACRPTIHTIEEVIRRHLLRGRHRALLILGSDMHEIHVGMPSVIVKSANRGELGIHYDGLSFNVSSISGSVTLNNVGIKIGDELPACCVITFGVEPDRKFVTFDVSNPEVMS